MSRTETSVSIATSDSATAVTTSTIFALPAAAAWLCVSALCEVLLSAATASLTSAPKLWPPDASLADLLSSARPPLAGAVDQLNRLEPALDAKKDRVDTALRKAPENYRKLVRIGSYGSFVNYYICSISVRVSDLQDRTAEFPAFRQEGGRCAEN